jgi:hypothetical protein
MARGSLELRGASRRETMTRCKGRQSAKIVEKDFRHFADMDRLIGRQPNVREPTNRNVTITVE